MSHLYPNYTSCWSSNDRGISDSLSKSLSLKVDSPTQLRLNAMPLGFQLQDLDSSSSQSTQSINDLTAVAGTNSQDQCMSSESGQEVGGDNSLGKMKPIYMMGHSETPCNTAHIDYSRTMTFMPYPCGDPYFNRLLPAYGPGPVMQTQIMGITSARVPLPVDDISEDEPIYVNAKQYHGILRRRQSRAKLEAQNKLIKARKPYLHESRHLHALNRVRGTGGRFLSTKKMQQSDSTTAHNHTNFSTNPFGHNTMGFDSHHQSQYSESSTANGDAFYQQSDSGFLGISAGGSMQQNDGFMNRSNQHHASVVR